VRAYAKK
jgi:hypothetical protein